MKGILKVGMIFLTTYSTFAVSGGYTGYTGYNAISSVQQRGCSINKGFEINLSTAHENPDGCPDNFRLEVSCDLPGFDQMVSISLTALAADKEMTAWVSGCDGEGQAKVVALKLKK